MALRDLATRKRFVKFSNATGWPLSNAMLGLKHQWVGRPREAVLGLPSRNCTSRRGVGSAFRARRLMSLHPGLKHPTSQSGSTELAEVLRRGWLFGVTYHNMRGAIASATAAWPILLDRSAVARKRPNSREGSRLRLPSSMKMLG